MFLFRERQNPTWGWKLLCFGQNLVLKSISNRAAYKKFVVIKFIATLRLILGTLVATRVENVKERVKILLWFASLEMLQIMFENENILEMRKLHKSCVSPHSLTITTLSKLVRDFNINQLRNWERHGFFLWKSVSYWVETT